MSSSRMPMRKQRKKLLGYRDLTYWKDSKKEHPAKQELSHHLQKTVPGKHRICSHMRAGEAQVHQIGLEVSTVGNVPITRRHCSRSAWILYTTETTGAGYAGLVSVASGGTGTTVLAQPYQYKKDTDICCKSSIYLAYERFEHYPSVLSVPIDVDTQTQQHQQQHGVL